MDGGAWTEPGYSPRGRKELDRTERLHFHFHFHFHQQWKSNVNFENILMYIFLKEGLFLKSNLRFHVSWASFTF